MFLQELREAFEEESKSTGRARLLLTVAVPAGIEWIQKGFDIPTINKYVHIYICKLTMVAKAISSDKQ